MGAVGQGAYGLVVAAKNKLTNEMVAVKKIEKAFEHRIFAKRTLRELICQRLLKHDNVPKSPFCLCGTDFGDKNDSTANLSGEI
jgi:serine/threonine protein kinase